MDKHKSGVPIYEMSKPKPPIMGIDGIDDWELRLKRQDAFWEREIIDRPVVCMGIPRSNPDYPMPQKHFSSHRERWFDTEYLVEEKLHLVMNHKPLGDALPTVFPDLGPEIFCAYFGTELEYSDRTGWAIPNLNDWSEVENLRFSADNFYWEKTLEMTDALLEAGKGKFYTGYTDLHPGGDALAGFRDPMNLNFDLIDHPEEVKKLLDYVDKVFIDLFKFWCDKLQDAGQAISTWPGIASSKRYHVPSNDFSCMISPAMFEEFFLPGIAKECDAAEASLYHLDGPGALQHLDALLSIKSLNAVQWIYGAGNGNASDWIEVYQRCQAAGKGIQITSVNLDELELLIDNLRPEGVWIRINDIEDEATADRVLKRLTKWH